MQAYKENTPSSPQVSIVIPAYNGEKYLSAAIESVLAQDYPNVDIWVIDNASTDQTRDVVLRYPQVHYVYSEIADTCLARNQGILLSQGEYVAFLDQDDIWMPQKLKRQMQFLVDQPNYGAVVCLQKMFLDEGCEKPHWLKQSFLNEPQEAYLPSALLVRRSVLTAMGDFDTQFSLASDVAWFFKAKHQGILVGLLDEVLLHRRIHDDNSSQHFQVLQAQILSVIKTSLQTRREK